MRCLNRIEMQIFLDKETDQASEKEILDHLKNCSKCSKLRQQALKDMSMIDKLLSENESNNNAIQVPEFKYLIPKRRTSIYYKIIPLIAAASIIGLIFWFSNTEKEPVSDIIPEADIIMYEFLDGKDLNKLWHDKTKIIIIQDEKGKVIQSTITY
jgi:hypothetical protein